MDIFRARYGKTGADRGVGEMINRPIVVAELGINFNADFDLLLKLVDMSFRSGCDLVKLQFRTPRLCVPETEWKKPRQWFDGSWTDYITYKERMELSLDQIHDLDIYIRDHYGPQKWFASVWDEQSLDRLMRFNVPYVKIPSAHATNLDLVRATRDTGRHTIVSLGMTTAEEKKEVIRLFDPSDEVTFMHTTSTYPLSDAEVNLGGIISLENIMYDIAWEEKNYQDEISWHIGFSSHSPSVYPAIYSALIGVEMIEVHATTDRTLQGSDHAASIEEPGLRLLCREIARIPVLMGTGQLDYFPSEESKRKSLRGS